MVTYYPAGPALPYAQKQLLDGVHPLISYISPNGQLVFNIHGALAPWPDIQSGVVLKSIKGLIPPWQKIEQKGATQDGSTFVDALYDPIEVDLVVEAVGNNPSDTRRVIRDWVDAWDVKRQGELSWTTLELGRWWAPVRWAKSPLDQYQRATLHGQEFGMVASADDGFWRTYDSTDLFGFAYEAMTDSFTTSYRSARNLGPNWPQRYDGNGGGYCTTSGDNAYWVDDPTDIFTTLSRSVVNGPYRAFSTATDNQVVSIVIGGFQEWSFPDTAANDIWLRMGRDGAGNWNGYGVRLRIMGAIVTWSRFNAFAETVLRQGLTIPPLPGEKFTAIAGVQGSARTFIAQRNGLDMWGLTVVESGTGSALGAAYRGVGFGMLAGGALLTQATPGTVRKISAGDNSTVSQSGFLRRVNPGDQPMFDRFTLFGPGLFSIGDGPGAKESVTIGPLLPNQVIQIRTDPRKRGIVDLTTVPPTPQELNFFQQAIKDFVSFATGNNVPPLLQEIESLFGIAPPQGNLYTLIEGRFSKPIPAKEAGVPVQSYSVPVTIDNGDARSKVIVSGTPRRRYPA